MTNINCLGLGLVRRMEWKAHMEQIIPKRVVLLMQLDLCLILAILTHLKLSGLVTSTQ
jgi:hypothetical protein